MAVVDNCLRRQQYGMDRQKATQWSCWRGFRSDNCGTLKQGNGPVTENGVAEAYRWGHGRQMQCNCRVLSQFHGRTRKLCQSEINISYGYWNIRLFDNYRFCGLLHADLRLLRSSLAIISILLTIILLLLLHIIIAVLFLLLFNMAVLWTVFLFYIQETSG